MKAESIIFSTTMTQRRMELKFHIDLCHFPPDVSLSTTSGFITYILGTARLLRNLGCLAMAIKEIPYLLFPFFFFFSIDVVLINPRAFAAGNSFHNEIIASSMTMNGERREYLLIRDT